MKLTHLSLFTGIGGLDLAAEHAGFITVGQCEWADYPTKILERHWPDVPRWRDIMTLTGEDFYERTGFRTVDIISGGFPCQPFSTAGNRRGKDDSRYLWPEMLRVIEELRPTWIIGENAAGIATMALDDILFELEEKNYKARAFLFPACSVGALHKRNRFAIVANTNGDGRTDESKFKPRTNASRRREAIYKRERSKIIHTWPNNYCAAREFRRCGILNCGVANPIFAEWLMGYPKNWTALSA